MENKTKGLIITGIIVILVISFAILIILSKNKVEIISEADAKFIGNNSILYIQTGCHFCLKQEKLFGENIKYLNVVDCFEVKNRENCSKIGIDVTPTWLINNIKYEGEKDLKELKSILKDNGINN